MLACWQDVLTGFQLVDKDFRLIVVEGLGDWNANATAFAALKQAISKYALLASFFQLTALSLGAEFSRCRDRARRCARAGVAKTAAARLAKRQRLLQGQQP